MIIEQHALALNGMEMNAMQKEVVAIWQVLNLKNMQFHSFIPAAREGTFAPVASNLINARRQKKKEKEQS